MNLKQKCNINQEALNQIQLNSKQQHIDSTLSPSSDNQNISAETFQATAYCEGNSVVAKIGQTWLGTRPGIRKTSLFNKSSTSIISHKVTTLYTTASVQINDSWEGKSPNNVFQALSHPSCEPQTWSIIRTSDATGGEKRQTMFLNRTISRKSKSEVL
jgi:hypothetical protein